MLPDRDRTSCYVLGPAIVTGKSVGSANVQYDSTNSQFVTNIHFKNNDFLDKIAQPLVGKNVAIELDGVVQSAPTINSGITGRDVEISGNFTQGEAKDLALVLRYGALPIQFDQSKQTVQSVSPSLGKDQLTAGIVAGLIGLGLVALYMLLFYRLLGLVVVFGLMLTGMLFFTVVSYLSSTHGLTLTLAGVTGIIVSVGVTVDSYVVYFERLKDEARTGKTIRSSLEPGFRQAFRTIIAADLVSLLGAAVLYAFATSSVRGFAFFLGLSTVMDLVARVLLHAPGGLDPLPQPEARAAPGCRDRGGARRAGSGGMTPPEGIPGVTRRHRPSDFYHERTNFQFIKHSRRWAILSGTLILISFIVLFTPRPQLRHRFRGRHVVAGVDGARPHRAMSPKYATSSRRSGSATRRSPRCRAPAARASTCRSTWSPIRSRPSRTRSRPTAASRPRRCSSSAWRTAAAPSRSPRRRASPRPRPR